MRADYDDLADIYKMVSQGNNSVSKIYNNIIGLRYARDWDLVQRYPTNSMEGRVRQLQLEEFKGIVPERSNGRTILKINLFGRRDSLLLR